MIGLQIFKGGDSSSPADYNGPREADGIINYLQKQSGPATSQLSSKDSVSSFVQKEVAVLGIFKGSGSAEFKTFASAADVLRDEYDFAHVFDASLLEGEAKPQVCQSDDLTASQAPADYACIAVTVRTSQKQMSAQAATNGCSVLLAGLCVLGNSDSMIRTAC